MKHLKTLLAAALFAAPLAAEAASVTIFETNGSVLVDLPLANGSLGDFFDDGLDALDISVTGGIAGGVVFADLLISDLSGAILQSSTVLDAFTDISAPDLSGAATEDTATIVFGGLTGAAAPQFGGMATVLFTFFAEDESGSFLETVNAKVLSDVAEVTPIPLPATLPLLGIALAGMVAPGRRHRRARA